MATGTEQELLQMSLTGKLPASLQQEFDREKEKGNAAYRRSMYQEAVNHYTAAEAINPISPLPPANRSMVYLKMKRFQQARDEAAVAFELHEALPEGERSEKLRVKILLRRATANKELMLMAMAADDFQAVLDLEDNDIAKAELEMLKAKYNITTTSRRRRDSNSSTRNMDATEKIRVISESSARVANGSPAQPKPPTHPKFSGIQDESPLLQIPKPVMQALTSKWCTTSPRSASEFERAWKSLGDSEIAQGTYLLNTVGDQQIANGLLGEGLTPQLLERIVKVLSATVRDNPSYKGRVADMLLALSKVSRFDMLLMFMSTVEKRTVAALVDSLHSRDVSDRDLCALRERYA